MTPGMRTDLTSAPRGAEVSPALLLAMLACGQPEVG